jgi:hypothetical protein
VLDAARKPAFPNARYVMSRTEWDFWTSNPDLRNNGLDDHVKELLVSCARNNLPPLQECIELLDGEKEIVPGVYAIPAPGHTRAHGAGNFVVQRAVAAHVRFRPSSHAHGTPRMAQRFRPE